MKIAFIWYWGGATAAYPFWRDGLRAALEEIEKEHLVDYFFDENIPRDEYDGYILWGDSNCPAIERIGEYRGKKGLCLTTNPTNLRNLAYFDAIYCESTPVYEEVRRVGLRAINAFGTDTKFFTPDKSVKKDLWFFYPATFSPWKRQEDLAPLGKDLLCIGTLQPDGQAQLDACKQKGVQVRVGYFPAEDILHGYRRARMVIIPAIHGSERTVLEAMSCDILPVVTSENKKARSYTEEFEQSDFSSPREFVLKHYNSKQYAQKILKGLQ